ncbi:MAG: hypothetical protein IAG10_26100, partial [Planctomycetaceae bacterium]|nr:hypothetical protein [Planctomycetaceae bacterium]
MNYDAVSPGNGLHLKTPPRKVSLSVLSEIAEGGDDEPPGRSALELVLPTQNGKAKSNGHSNGHSNGSSNGHTNGRSNGHANGVAVVDAPTSAVESDFVIGPKSQALRERAFPDVSDAEWNDWKWQLRNRVKDVDGLSRVLNLSDDERNTVNELGGKLPVGITPYYASLMDPDDPLGAIRKTMVPTHTEFTTTPGEEGDPLGEDADSPVPGLVHRYPDRVLFLVTSFCAVYCRYCTRSRLVGQTGEYHFNTKQHQAAIDYIAAHPEIRDVLISGG